jgi:hypothetical protein
MWKLDKRPCKKHDKRTYVPSEMLRERREDPWDVKLREP